MIDSLDYDILRKTLKVLVPFVTGLSIVKQTVYYWLFGINIWNYAGIEEVLTPIIKDLTFYTFLLLLPTIIILLFAGKKIGDSNVESFKKNKNRSFVKRLFYTMTNDFILIPNVLSIIYFLYLGKTFWQIFAVSGIVILSFIIFFIRQEFLIMHNIEITKRNATILNISNMLILVFLLSIWNCLIDANQVKNGITKEVTIITEKETIYCKNSKNYIGRTKSYTFIFNKKSRETEIIENSIIKKEKFRI